MQYYKDGSGIVYAYTEEQVEGGWVEDGLVEMTQAEIDAHLAPPPTPVPDRVTARQFGLQMIAAGIKTQVDTWVGSQDAATQWAYERSATFVRDDPMMRGGFVALGYTEAQIDNFFVAAAAL